MFIRSFAVFFLALTSCYSQSPDIAADGSVTFRLNAQKAQSVLLSGQWTKEKTPLQKDAAGLWTAHLEGIPAGVWEYSFQVDGLTMIDPQNTALKPQRSPSASILHLPSSPLAAWDFQDVPHGTVHLHDYDSKVVGRLRHLAVYTPPGYEANSSVQYPLLVLQHGSGDKHSTWVEHGKAHWILDSLIASKKAVPMIVMMIDGHPQGMVQRSDVQKRIAAIAMFEQELLTEAMPLVKQTYRVSTAPDHCAIAGLSMGGSQSIQIGLGHPEIFSHIGAFSTAPTSPEIAQKLTSDPAGLNAKLKLFWIACGKEDFLLEKNNEFLKLLTDKGVHHVSMSSEGGHSWPVWREYLTIFAPLLFKNICTTGMQCIRPG